MMLAQILEDLAVSSRNFEDISEYNTICVRKAGNTSIKISVFEIIRGCLIIRVRTN
jgi:hypothetical protein